MSMPQSIKKKNFFNYVYLYTNLLINLITIATEKVYHLGEAQTINRVIHKKVDFKRETSLLNILTGCN